jgi:hypothetical protein
MSNQGNLEADEPRGLAAAKMVAIQSDNSSQLAKKCVQAVGPPPFRRRLGCGYAALWGRRVACPRSHSAQAERGELWLAAAESACPSSEYIAELLK